MEPQIIVLCVVAGLAGYVVWDQRRKRIRRKTLRYDPARESYVWIDFDGRERSDARHPEAPGGAWHFAALGGVGGGHSHDGGGGHWSDGGGGGFSGGDGGGGGS